MSATTIQSGETSSAACERAGVPVHAVAGRCAQAVLDAGRGNVEAVFERTAYLGAGAGLLCLGGGDLVRGPLNLCVDGCAMPLAGCRQGAPWCYRDGVLAIEGSPVLRMDTIEPWAPAPVAETTPATVARGLGASGVGGSRAAAPESAAGSAGALAARRLADAASVLSRWLDAALAAETAIPPVPDDALALLGCGPGLTPSGDDVLVGVLITLTGLGEAGVARTLGQTVRRHMHERTGRISAAHLAGACDGEAVAPVHALVSALARGEVAACADAATRLRGYGQSSGGDALAGIVMAASAWAARAPG